MDQNGDKLLLHCYSEEGAYLYRFYINGLGQTIGGIQKYLEKMILAKNPVVINDADLTGYYDFKNTIKKA